MTYRYTITNNELCDVTTDGEHIAKLLAVFQRVCGNLDLDAGDHSLARTVARTLIEAGLDGEDDTDELFERAMRAALAS